ncbi:hypothetical protein C8F04DRAFT_1068350 [Mycena alexandri]|uniref:Uncharacterized protein n=1 Tax=Mycena alexandri TaxID=1745969 RepID=A0AAD6TGK1_9AGAR|nr:hypothetical protein C8F04DRAFT_1068350 [Mycena alexandri]
MSPKKHRKASNPSPQAQCSTLLEDEITRCSEIPTHGRPIERCRVHHEQYCTMTKRYKEAQKFVDETFAGALIPTKADILEYTSVSEILEKARLMKKYVNAIRQERTGRDIHHNRFFLKVDDGHKFRIKVLAKQMAQGVEIRDALEARAMVLYLKDHPAKDWVEQFQTGPIGEDDDVNPGQDTYLYESRVHLSKLARPPQMIPRNEDTGNIIANVWLQYTRRIIFHHPQLFAKALDKVSFKDFVMDDDFGYEDVLCIAELYVKHLKIGLRWWKDSWTEAIAMKDSAQASANMGNVENRFKILGGWIYNNSRDIPAPNKVWHGMFTAETPERDTENRFVRLCCNFDDYNTPSFCASKVEGDPRDSKATRNHLSLCGVILADLPGCITWVELQMRAYMFGAIRNEPDDFTTAFLRELRARPDIFSVVTRSDTDPPLKVESFGDATDQARNRQFEAPFQPVGNAPAGRGTWNVMRSAFNVLYGGGQGPYADMAGYLSPGYNNTKGKGGRLEISFFYHKRFPVKYFLILSASPTQNVHDLARQVAWAAFRAKGLVHGDYDKKKYDKASDVLFTQHARERLSFLPEGSFSIGNLASKS